MKILHLDSSILGENSVSRKISAEIVAKLKAQNVGTTVVYHDFGATPLPHLSGATLFGQNAADAALGQQMIDELFAADVLVIGAPMYNFGLSSALKAWIDRVAVAGKTFRYGANGPEGLVTGKVVYVASSRGGVYSAGVMLPFDHQETHLQAVLGFLGMGDVRVIRAEGVNMGPDVKAAAVAGAEVAVAAL